jgi:hypothetical protein
VLLVVQRERATITWDRTICGTQDQAARRELLAAIRAHVTQNGNPEPVTPSPELLVGARAARGPARFKLLKFRSPWVLPAESRYAQY